MIMNIRPIATFAPIVLAMLSLFVSCAANSSTTSTTTTAATPPVTSHKGRGVVVAVNVEKARVKLNHERIEGYMDAMTMWFDVKDASLLNGINAGDRVEFTLVEEASADVITELRKSPA